MKKSPLYFILLSTLLFAEETSVSISPSPINNSFYNTGGKGTSKHTATFFEQADDTFTTTMLGYTYAKQMPTKGNFFGTYSFGVFNVDGASTSDLDVDIMGLNAFAGVHGGYRLFSTNKFSLLAFGGAQAQRMSMNTTFTISETNFYMDVESDSWTNSLNLQAGVHASYMLNSLVFSAFWMRQNIQSSSITETTTVGTNAGFTESDASFDTTSSSIGLDITTRSGWSLSGVSQALTGATSESTSIMIQIGWLYNNGKFGGYDISANGHSVDNTQIDNTQNKRQAPDDDVVYY